MLFYGDKLVGISAESYLFAVLKAGLPIGFGGGIGEMIVLVAEVGLAHIVRELSVGEGSLLKTSVNTGAVKSNGVKGSEHSNVRQYR